MSSEIIDGNEAVIIDCEDTANRENVSLMIPSWGLAVGDRIAILRDREHIQTLKITSFLEATRKEKQVLQ